MTRVLVDTTVWIDHLHRSDPRLTTLLESDLVVAHPMVVGELALGSIRERQRFLILLENLVAIAQATPAEVLTMVESRSLCGRGLSLIDANLLASSLIAHDLALWTRDRKLADAAAEASVSWDPPSG